MEPLTLWEGRKLHLLLPTYKTINPSTHYTLFANYAKYGAEKIGFTMHEGTVIHEARNIIVHKALKENPDAEEFLFVDDDMALPCGSEAIFNGNFKAGLPPFNASLQAFSRIMSHPKDKRIVGALYYGRHEFGGAQNDLGFGLQKDKWNTEFRAHQHHGLMPMQWLGTGFLKIHRSVFTDLMKAIDEGRFPGCEPPGEGLWYGFFTPIKTGVGEDVSFGVRCHHIGIPSYLDCDLECLHCDGSVKWGSRNTRNPL